MLMPKRVKYRKAQRRVRQLKGTASRGNRVAFGDFGLQVISSTWLTARQLEAGRVAISHYLKGEGKYWIRVFPHKSVTKKPLEVRMGGGKADIDYWCAVLKPGSIVYEIGGVPEEIAKTALNRASHKMPVKCRMAVRLPEV